MWTDMWGELETDKTVLKKELVRNELLRQQWNMSCIKVQQLAQRVMEKTDVFNLAWQDINKAAMELQQSLKQQAQVANAEINKIKIEHTKAIQDISRATLAYETALKKQHTTTTIKTPSNKKAFTKKYNTTTKDTIIIRKSQQQAIAQAKKLKKKPTICKTYNLRRR